MQYALDTEKMLKEGWLTPAQAGEIYRGAMDALHGQFGIFDAMGSATLLCGFAVLASLPLIWAMSRWDRE